VNVGGRRDREIRETLARLPAACGDSRLQATPLTRDSIINGQRVRKPRFDEAKPRGSSRPGLSVASKEQPEVQLRDRHRTDCGQELSGQRVLADEHRRVKNHPQRLGRPGITQPTAETLEILPELTVDPELPQVCQLGRWQPCSCAHGTELRDRATRDGDRELLTGLGSPQDLADVVAKLLLGDDGHPGTVA
jgi:hypothetical protein